MCDQQSQPTSGEAGTSGAGPVANEPVMAATEVGPARLGPDQEATPPRPDAPKVEAASVEAPKVEAPEVEASKIEAEITGRLGSNHVQAVRLRNEMQEYRRLMFQEISRIAQSYKSDLEVSEAREKSLAESVAKATDISNSASETQVQLRELQREAETYKNMYQTFLHKHLLVVVKTVDLAGNAAMTSASTAPNMMSNQTQVHPFP